MDNKKLGLLLVNMIMGSFSFAISPYVGDKEERDEAGCTPLMLAAMAGDISRVDELKAQGVDLNAQDKCGWTSLMLAIRFHQPAMAIHLINIPGVALDMQDGLGLTALMFAAMYGFLDVVEALLLRGAAVNILDRERHSALTKAQLNGYEDVVERLRVAGGH